jgi:hypothetical protein
MMDVDIGKALPAVADIGYQGIELAVTPGWPSPECLVELGMCTSRWSRARQGPKRNIRPQTMDNRIR